MARFQTKLIKSKARFEVKPLSAQQMLAIAQPVRDDIEQRILRAETVTDSPAPPLSQKRRLRKGRQFEAYTEVNIGSDRGYTAWKSKRYPPAIRNWRLTGRTLRSMKVLSVQENKAVIGFTDSVSNFRAYINNRRSRQFGVSPRNQKTLIEKYRAQKSGVSVRQVA
jgi:hypothetical protein